MRTWARTLAGMQKEAIVLNATTGVAWRLASDEGPYLAGHDAAPCPLSFLTTGMVASYMDTIRAAATAAGMSTDGIRLTLDNTYTMEGSARAGTMTGGALTPRLTVELGTGGASGVTAVIDAAVRSSPIAGLLSGVHESLFTLTVNGSREDVARVAAHAGRAEPDPADLFGRVHPTPSGDDVIRRLVPAAEVEGVPGGVESSLQEHQSRTLHVRGVCTVGDDGVKHIVQNLYSPIGSEFRFLCDEAVGFGGGGRAPDAVTYMSAGIAFCFMTQFGRYATIVKRDLDAYRIVQDTCFDAGGCPVETHVHLETPEGVEFARTALDMSEQTCFLHALCRTDLATEVHVVPRSVT